MNMNVIASPADPKNANRIPYSDLDETRQRWELYGLPEDMTRKSFLDVGCWTGGFCLEAKRRGAERVLGIDMVKSPLVNEFQRKSGFEFLLCDIFSDKYLELPSFDIVFCAGVLYHVENVISLLYRLKIKALSRVVIETEIFPDEKFKDTPILRFYPEKELDDNYSNWWVPNVLCLKEMLNACQFEEIRLVYENSRRACFHATPKNEICRKILPRRESLMDS